MHAARASRLFDSPSDRCTSPALRLDSGFAGFAAPERYHVERRALPLKFTLSPPLSGRISRASSRSRFPGAHALVSLWTQHDTLLGSCFFGELKLRDRPRAKSSMPSARCRHRGGLRNDPHHKKGRRRRLTDLDSCRAQQPGSRRSALIIDDVFRVRAVPPRIAERRTARTAAASKDHRGSRAWAWRSRPRRRARDLLAQRRRQGEFQRGGAALTRGVIPGRGRSPEQIQTQSRRCLSI